MFLIKKSQILTYLGILTIIGIVFLAASLLNLSQLPNYTLAQAWNELWDQHHFFTCVITIYCCVMVTCDIYFIAVFISEASERHETL